MPQALSRLMEYKHAALDQESHLTLQYWEGHSSHPCQESALPGTSIAAPGHLQFVFMMDAHKLTPLALYHNGLG